MNTTENTQPTTTQREYNRLIAGARNRRDALKFGTLEADAASAEVVRLEALARKARAAARKAGR
jgi:hypothetical protein